MAVGGVTLLAIESATDMVGVALIRDDGAAAERVHHGGRAHAELLAPAIKEICAVSGCAVADIDRIAVDVGPGLFTGLRVGVATAKALAQALGIGVLGVSSLDVLAAAVLDRAAPTGAEVGVVASVVDARRGEVFAAVYRFGGARGASRTGRAPVRSPRADPESVRQERPQPIGPEVLEEWLVGLAADAGRVTVVGDGATRYRHLLAVHGSLDLRWADELSAPPPLVQARLALDRLARGVPTVPASEVVPDYRRPADARINWEQRGPRPPAPGNVPPG